mmetsp:Transcript_17704/g.49015  ORF Transcript_17704/g.49015 Transcript_17704/m.49015 type:complete len:268 (-) Transcript_17704:92-895(-)
MEKLQRVPLVSNTSTGNSGVANNDRKEPCQQNQYWHQRQEHHHGISSSSNYNAGDVPGCPNGSRGNQGTNNSSFPRGKGSAPTQSGVQIESATSSTIVRPGSSYGRRPALGPLNNSNASDTSSSSISMSGAVMTDPSFNPNSNVNNGNNSNSSSSNGNNNTRRVSLGNQHSHQHHHHHHHHPMSKNAQHLNANNKNNSTIKVHTVSQTLPTRNSSDTGNHCSNPQHKRPPLGNIIPSGATSEIAAKRPKQQHHNPYQQSYSSGRKSM